jgi:hypothetical protein
MAAKRWALSTEDGDTMRNRETAVAVFPVRRAESAPEGGSASIATIVSIAPDGRPEVHFDNDGPAVPARLAVRTTRARIETAIAAGQQAVVVFEGGDRSRPLIVGFIEALDQPQPDAPEGMPVVEADVDGRRVRVTAQDEIVLECGSASVTLRRNGRVVIRGTYVETRSDGTNRIKGGQVQIN